MTHKSVKTINRNHTTTTIDKLTGEVLQEQSTTSFTTDAEPAFFKLYLANISMLHNLTVSNNKILNELLKIGNYAGEAIINSTIKKRICEKLNTTIATFDNNLVTLKKQNIIKQQGRGVYLFNPELFGRGSWTKIMGDRTKYQKLEMKIQFKGDKEATRTIVTELVPDYEAMKNDGIAEEDYYKYENSDDFDEDGNLID